MRKIGSRGFSAVGVILILVIIGAISGAGFYVYNSQKKATPSIEGTDNAKQSQADSSKADEDKGGLCGTGKTYHGQSMGQTIKEFSVGGSFATTPGTVSGHHELSSEAVAFDVNCKSIPLSEIKIGDKVVLHIDVGPTSGHDTTYFVKAIQKTQ